MPKLPVLVDQRSINLNVLHIFVINRGDIILYKSGRYLIDLLDRAVGVKVFILIIFIFVLLSSLAIPTTNVAAGVFAHPGHMPFSSSDGGMLKNSIVQVLTPDAATSTPMATPQPSATVTPAIAMTAQPVSTETVASTTVLVSVVDLDGSGRPGQPVYVFNGAAYTGKHGLTNAGGQVSITLPSGSYHFRSDFNNTQFWSSASNACDTSNGCNSATITITRPVTITVKNTDGTALPGLPVYAFDGNTFKGFSGNTDANGQSSLTLPQGNYRFRADLNATQFWSGVADTCVLPGCTTDSVIVTTPVTITVKDTSGAAQAGLNVFVFTGTTYTNYSGKTDANGQVSLTLPQGNYHFRADLNGTQFWSGTDNTCMIPNCTTADITVTLPVSVKVEGVDHSPFEGIQVYAFDGTTYKGYSGTSGKDGLVSFTLPAGNYRFRGDLESTQFWSSTDNQCILPGCATATITLPGGSSSESKVTINYKYDNLSRLREANYSDGTYYHYSYDATGNRLTESTQTGTKAFTYDQANRLINAGGVVYQWDANGNLINNGTTTYSFNAANQLVGLNKGTQSIVYKYTGLGDRLQQINNGTTTNYTLDINSGLTQVLQDGTNTYLYGNGRISQVAATQTGYFLPDALGSVRQMVDQTGALSLAKSFDPYGNVISSSGAGQTIYGFDGEQQDRYIKFLDLRARTYSTETGRFLSKDTWQGDENQPASYNKWLYTYANPINLFDPSGLDVGCPGMDDSDPRCLPLPSIVIKVSTCTPPPIVPISPSPIPFTPIPPTQAPTIKYSKRADEIHNWALTLGYSTEEVLSSILEREATDAYIQDSIKWSIGDQNSVDKRPVFTIFKEAATRWFWSYIKDPKIVSINGPAINKEDREVMILNWMVPAMQSEDGLTKDLLVTYHNALIPQFMDTSKSLTDQSMDSDWKMGNGMWSWANAYLYIGEGPDILAKNHHYRYGEGSTTWYIFDAATVNKLEPFRKPD